MARSILHAALVLAALSPPSRAGSDEEGYVTTGDGVRLFYQKAGTAPKTVLAPGRLFLFEDFRVLGERFTVISYDMRNRGRSDFVPDGARLTLTADVEDLETVRRHFGVERFSVVGYSYLGKMAVLYARAHPGRVERIVQMGAVPMVFGTEYPEVLRNDDRDRVLDPEARARLRRLREEGFHLEQPEKYCEEEWKVTRVALVGDPAAVAKLGDGYCSMPNEWPTNLARHFFHHFTSVQKLDVTPEQAASIRIPVLTVHGTRDRNAPYGAGREWALHLGNARLLTVEGAAHQSWVERPGVLSAIESFLGGEWPEGVEDVTSLDRGQ